MAAPSVRGSGTPAFSSSGSVIPALPAHQANDILVVAGIAQQNVTLTGPGGSWAEFPDSQQAINSGSNQDSIRLGLWWLRASSSSETNPTLTTPSFVGGVCYSIQGCETSGNPFDVTSGGAVSSTSISAAGDTTTVDDCFVMVFVGTSRDASSAVTFSSWANADLTGFGEILDTSSPAGSGGGFGVATGTKTSAGLFGATTVTSAATEVDHAFITVAFKPPTPGAATTFDFGVEPSNAVAGVVISPDITVRAEDSGGTLDTSFTGNVTLAITGGGTLGGTLTQAAVAGVATFNDILIQATGTYTLTATGSLTATESASFNITPAAADETTTTITANPTTIQAGGVSTSDITVQAKDEFGNNLTAGGETVTLATTAGSLGSVTDEGDGTYTAVLTSGMAATTATVTGELNAVAITDDAEVVFTAGNVVALSWDDLSSIEDNFSLERQEDGGAWVEIATPAANATSYEDSVTSGHTYRWRIKSVNANGSSSYATSDFVVVA